MRKIIRRTGNSLGVFFDREDQEAYELEVGDVIEMTITKIKKAKK